MLDPDSGDQPESSPTPVPDLSNQGAQETGDLQQEKVSDNQPANTPTLAGIGNELQEPALASANGKPAEPTSPTTVTGKPALATAAVSDQAAELQAAARPSIGLLQMINRPAMLSTSSKAASQVRLSNSTQSPANRREGVTSSASVAKTEILGAPVSISVFDASSTENSPPQPDTSTAETSPLTSSMPPAGDAQSNTIDPSTPLTTDLKQVPVQAGPNSAASPYDAFTIELRSKSSARDGMNTASAVSSATWSTTSPDSSLPSNITTQNDSAAAGSSPIGQQSVPFIPTITAGKPAQRDSELRLQNRAQAGSTETPLTEKVEPQETGQMEASPVSASTPAVKSQTIALSAASSIPEKRKSAGEQAPASSHNDASQVADLRAMASADWKAANQVRSPILEKNQSSAPVQPNDTQEQVAGGLVKQIVLKVEDPSGQNVSVRLTDRGSQVTLGVRSNDSAVSAALKQDLPSLVSNLDRAGWRVDSLPTVHMAGHEIVQTTVAHQSSDDQHSKGRPAPEWNDNQQGKKRSTAELWEEVLNRQSSY